MKISFFCPRWGSENLDFEIFCKKVRESGYDGVEMSLPCGDHKATDRILRVLRDEGLQFIAQHWETSDTDVDTHIQNMKERLAWLVSAEPLFINSQTGKDWFGFEQNKKILEAAAEIAASTGVRILHETHRGKFAYSAAVARRFLESNKDLRISADFSHWCVVSESLLEDQTEAMKLAISRTDHIHTRVGFAESPQVSDPRAPEWKQALDAHLAWWDAIVAAHRDAGDKSFTVTTEFGPFPYLPALPWTGMPVADQWGINLFMKDLLKKRWGV